jgi:hypothetical protein
MRRGSTEIVTEFRMTEISIQVDEFGSIEHREITIESTQIESIDLNGGGEEFPPPTK